eukprot:12894208-Prorocentrum_lima.AAC.1
MGWQWTPPGPPLPPFFFFPLPQWNGLDQWPPVRPTLALSPCPPAVACVGSGPDLAYCDAATGLDIRSDETRWN